MRPPQITLRTLLVIAVFLPFGIYVAVTLVADDDRERSLSLFFVFAFMAGMLWLAAWSRRL